MLELILLIAPNLIPIIVCIFIASTLLPRKAPKNKKRKGKAVVNHGSQTYDICLSDKYNNKLKRRLALRKFKDTITGKCDD